MAAHYYTTMIRAIAVIDKRCNSDSVSQNDIFVFSEIKTICWQSTAAAAEDSVQSFDVQHNTVTCVGVFIRRHWLFVSTVTAV